MSLYPVNLNIAGWSCAVIGGGMVAYRKIQSLLAAEAVVTVIAPRQIQPIQELAAAAAIKLTEREYRAGDLTDFRLVVCATDRADVNAAAATEAQTCGALVNVTDRSYSGDFTVPARLELGELLLTVSTGGQSPAVARWLKQDLAKRYGEEYKILLDIITGARAAGKARCADAKRREQMWRSVDYDRLLAMIKAGKLIEAEAELINAISSFGVES